MWNVIVDHSANATLEVHYMFLHIYSVTFKFISWTIKHTGIVHNMALNKVYFFSHMFFSHGMKFWPPVNSHKVSMIIGYSHVRVLHLSQHLKFCSLNFCIMGESFQNVSWLPSLYKAFCAVCFWKGHV